jgi:hypothetical protein
MQGRPPDFLIVGHQKSGTTALYAMLREHPQIYMPAEKEPRFLAPELSPVGRGGKTPKRPATLDQYLALFAGARPDQRAGEASPQYLRYDDSVPQRIAEVAPDARLIAILREPASFLESYHRQQVHNLIETEGDFRAALALEDARRAGRQLPPDLRRPEMLFYSDHIRYARQLAHFHARFPPERMLVLIYDDFRADNDAVVRRTLRFLDVDDSFSFAPVETRRLRDVRHLRLHQLSGALRLAERNPAASTPAMRAFSKLVPAPVRGEAFRARWRRLVYTPAAKPPDDFLAALRRRFKPEVEAVSDYLGRDLVSLWRYDQL